MACWMWPDDWLARCDDILVDGATGSFGRKAAGALLSWVVCGWRGVVGGVEGARGGRVRRSGDTPRRRRRHF